MKRLAVSYIRFSSKPQEKGLSLSRQIDGTEKLCLEEGLRHLDPSLRFEDLATSGYSGIHRLKGAFGDFLALIRDPKGQQRVPPGSVFVCENIDRFGREKPRLALAAWLEILNYGMWIATVSPKRIFTPDASEWELMEALVEMSRAHKESERKSNLLKSTWESKRRSAAEGKKAAKYHDSLTYAVPAWIDPQTRKLIPERAEVVRRIVRLALAGRGAIGIIKTLNSEKVPTFTRGKRKAAQGWYERYVNNILKSKALYGAFQPHTKGKKEAGEPIENYFEPIITLQEHYRIQEGLQGRYRTRGRQGKHIANLFTGCLFDAATNSPFLIVSKSSRKINHRRLVSRAARFGNEKEKTFPAHAFEQGFLLWWKELDMNTLFSQPPNSAESKIAALEGKKGELQKRIDALTSKLETDEDFTAGFELLKKWSDQVADINKQLGQLRVEAAMETTNPTLDTLALIEELETSKGDLTSIRTALKNKIRQTVDRIMVLVLDNPPIQAATQSFWGGCFGRIAVSQVVFKNGQQRAFVVGWKQGRVTNGAHRPQAVFH